MHSQTTQNYFGSLDLKNIISIVLSSVGVLLVLDLMFQQCFYVMNTLNLMCLNDLRGSTNFGGLASVLMASIVIIIQ